MFCYVELLEVIKPNDAKKKQQKKQKQTPKNINSNSLIIHQANWMNKRA